MKQLMRISLNTRLCRCIPSPSIGLLVFLAVHITGCRSVPEGSPALKQQALTFAPPSGMAGVYAIRRPGLGSAILFDVALDYQDWGSLATSSYLFGFVAPGDHILSAPRAGGRRTPPGAGIHFTAEAGRDYYFRITAGSTFGSVPDIIRLSESEGQANVRNFTLSGDNRFEAGKKKGPITTEQITQEYRRGRSISIDEAITTVQEDIKILRPIPASLFSRELADFSLRYGTDREVLSADTHGITAGTVDFVLDREQQGVHYGRYKLTASQTYPYSTVTKIVLEDHILSNAFSGMFLGTFNQDLHEGLRFSKAILLYRGESLLVYHPASESTNIRDLLSAYLMLCPNVK